MTKPSSENVTITHGKHISYIQMYMVLSLVFGQTYLAYIYIYITYIYIYANGAKVFNFLSINCF